MEIQHKNNNKLGFRDIPIGNLFRPIDSNDYY